jgi:hypothetical protein
MGFITRPHLLLSLAVAVFFLAVTPPAEAATRSLQVRQMVYTGATPTAPVLPPQASPPMIGNGPIVGALYASSSLEQPSRNQSLPAALLSQIEALFQAVRRLARHELPPHPAQSDEPAPRIAPAPPTARVFLAGPIPYKASAPSLPSFIDTHATSTRSVQPQFPSRDQRKIDVTPPRVLAYPFISTAVQVPIAIPFIVSLLGTDGSEPPLIDAISIGLTGIALALSLRFVWVLLI